MIQLALLSEQPLVLEGFRALGALLGEASVYCVCRSPDELRSIISSANRPNIILVDLNPETALSELADLCERARPGKVLLVARRISPELAYQAREFGVAAVLSSCSPLEELAEAIRRVEKGEIVLDDVLNDGLQAARTVRLTPREGQLVSLLAQGLKNKEIAHTLGISEGTVKVYLSKLFQKVGAKDRFELALFGLKNISNATYGLGESSHEPDRPGTGVKVRNLQSLVMRPAPAPDVQRFIRVAG